MSESRLIFTREPLQEAARLIEGHHTVVFTDTNCRPLIAGFLDSRGLPAIVMEAGETHKNLDTVTEVWTMMQRYGCTRKSLLLNFGGGVVTDLGGFAAATFKRGIPFINIPTTLLGAVDASVGGKTGIDFNGLKNEIGVFREAERVIISTAFFGTLPREELLSGYAEMIKHALLSSADEYRRLIAFDIAEADTAALLPLLEENVKVKEKIVMADPTEKSVRRYLNLGHTAGHAIESLAIQRHIPIQHGYAVAVGMVVALVLSHIRLGLPSDMINELAAFIRSNYGGLPSLPLGCDDYPALLELMSHDKKNPSPDAISFTLLKAAGEAVAGQIIDPDTLRSSLDITRDLLGI